MLLYIFLILLLFLVITFMQMVKLIKPKKVIEKGEIISDWVTSNGLWFTTKLFIIGLSVIFLSPKLLTVTINNGGTNDEQSIIEFINSIEINFILPSQLDSGSLLFIIIYLVTVIGIINIPFKYALSTNGIFYEIPLVGIISFYAWEEIVCYDIENKRNGIVLKLWFRPPCFAPDWNISVEKKVLSQVENIMKQKSIHYNEARHKLKNASKQGGLNI